MNRNWKLLSGACLLHLLLLTACTNDERPAGPDARQGSAVAFSVSDDTVRATTRTAQGTTDISVLQTEGFGVFACYTGLYRYVSSTTTSNLMWNQQVTYDNTLDRWTYSPLAYWPSTESGGDDTYATFFAYAPYSDGTSDAASACIVDFSLPGETGDPWLTYQLGGTMYADGADGWKARQVDLLYDIQRDQQRPYLPSASRVTFLFRHALACVGDRITVTCSDALQAYLKSLYSGSDVTFTLNTLCLAYTLTQKGRLVLNGSATPNWKAVDSGDATVTRLLVFNPDQVIATVTSATDCTLTDYAVTDQGIFYIPLELDGHQQSVTTTVDYTFSTGDSGQLQTTLSLSSIRQAGEERDLRLVLSLP